MRIFDSLFGRKPCMVCGRYVKESNASKIMVTSMDITSASSDYGKECDACHAFVHYRCSKLSAKREGPCIVKEGYCPKCGRPLLRLLTSVKKGAMVA